MDRTQTHRETPLHAPESGDTRLGDLPGTLALEHLSRLLPGRGRPRESELVGSAEDEDPTPGRVKRSRTVSAVRRATSRKAREVAHPRLFRGKVKKQTRVI